MSRVTATETFRAARDFLLEHRDDPQAAYAGFRWPELPEFNWALDWFDGVLAAERPNQTALWLVTADGDVRMTFEELSRRSTQVAGWLREQEVRRGDRVLLMLGNVAPLWEITLAAAKIGAVVIPASTLLGPADIADRIERGNVSFAVAASADTGRFADVPGTSPGSRSASRSRAGCATRTRRPRWPASSRTGRPAAPTRCCSTSPPAPPPGPSWCCIPTSATRSGTCRRCTGSG